MFLTDSNGVIGIVNYNDSTLNFVASNASMAGTYQYYIVLTVNADLMTYVSNTASLTLTDPCLHTEVISKAIDSSVLTCSYDATCLFTLTSWMDTVD